MSDTTNSTDDSTTDSTTDRPFTAATGGVSNLFYFTVPAPDLERSKAFFGQVLGWEIAGGSLGGHIAGVTPPGGLSPGASPEELMVRGPRPITGERRSTR